MLPACFFHEHAGGVRTQDADTLRAGQIHESINPINHKAKATASVITSQNFQKLLNALFHPG